VNTYTPDPPAPDPGTVTIYKTFEGYEGEMPFNDLVFKIDFTLYDSDDGIEDTLHPSISGNDWSGTFDDVDPGSGYYVVEEPFTWEGPGYWTSDSPSKPFVVSEGADTKVTITNTYHLDEEPTYTVDIEKTVSPGSHYTGQGPVSYEITFTNTSTLTNYAAVAFMDETSENWEVNSENASNFSAVFEGVEISDNGGEFFDGPKNLAGYGDGVFDPGDVITITYDVDSSGLGVDTYTNTVTGCAFIEPVEPMYTNIGVGDILSDNMQDDYYYVPDACDTDDDSFTVRNRTVTRDYDPGIKIEKDVDLDEASIGDIVVYTIEVENNGDYDLENVIVVDEMIDEEWDIGNLDQGDSISKDFDYEIQEGDFKNGEFVNVAEVTGDWSRGSVSGEDDAVVDELIIEVPDEPEIPETPPEIIVPPVPAVPQALPKTGQVPPELFYGLGSILMAAGYGLGRKKKD